MSENQPPRFAGAPSLPTERPPAEQRVATPRTAHEASTAVTAALAGAIDWHLRQRGTAATIDDLREELGVEDTEHLSRALELAARNGWVTERNSGAYAAAEVGALVGWGRP